MGQALSRGWVTAFYDAYAKRDFERFADFLHEDVHWTVSGPVDLLFYCGERHSRDEVIQIMKTAVPKIFRERRFDVEQILVDGENAAVLAQLTGVKHDGRVTRFRVAHFVQFRDGKIARLMSVIDSFNAVEQTFGVHLDVGDKRRDAPQNENLVAV